MGSKMFSTGSKNISRFDRDNSTIRMGNKSSRKTNRVDNSTSSSMGSLSSINLSCISRYHSTIRMVDQSRVTKIRMGDSRDYSTISIGHQGSGGDSNTGSKNQKL